MNEIKAGRSACTSMKVAVELAHPSAAWQSRRDGLGTHREIGPGPAAAHPLTLWVVRGPFPDFVPEPGR